MATVTDSFRETLTEGSIVERIVLGIGLAALLYALYQGLVLILDLHSTVSGTDGVLQSVMVIFIAAIVAIVATTLAVAMDFSWDDGEH